MPAFGGAYSDAEIAALANYVIARFGTRASPVTAQDVAELRKDYGPQPCHQEHKHMRFFRTVCFRASLPVHREAQPRPSLSSVAGARQSSIMRCLSFTRGSRLAGLIYINEAMALSAMLLWQVAALWRNLFQNRLVGGLEEHVFRQPWKDSNHVTSNDLLIGCIGHHRHRVRCDGFN